MPRITWYETLDWLPGYRIGTDGSVWSRWKQLGNHKGYGVKGEWRKLADLNGNNGYRCVRLKKGNWIIHLRIHRLVLEAFVGPRPKGLVCRHLNGNPADNRLWNLCWGSKRQNSQDTMRHGRVPKGENHHWAKLNADKIKRVFLWRWSGETFVEIGKRLGVCEAAARDIFHRRNWAHIPIPERPNGKKFSLT